MAQQVYVFYEKTNPFSGWIRMRGTVDPNQPPDGSTLQERLVALKVKYPDSDYYLFPLGTIVDPEAMKFDQGTSTLITLDPADITPKAWAVLNAAQKKADISANLPSWTAIENRFNSIRAAGAAATTISALKGVLASFLDLEEKHTRITYWLAKNSKD